ncbi:MAG: alpha/beta hydrolase [bacterium]|nr:alpha/beta hydrolase [bacterium]
MRRIFTLFAVMALLAVGAASAVASSDVAPVEVAVASDDIEHRDGGGHGGEITEEVITFENDGGTVYGTFVMPANAKRKTATVLMLHGFTGNRDEGPVLQPDFTFTDTMYSRTAQVLAENGIASLRIDFRGSGESLDQFGFEGTTFSGQVSDAYAAVEWLDDQRKVGDIGILGLSQGGLVGAITAESHRKVRSLVLWSPVANPVDTYKTVLGSDSVLTGLTQPSTTAILPWGAEVTLERPFFEELYTTDPIAAISHYSKPLQIVVGSGDTIVTPQPNFGQTYMTYHEGEEELVVLDTDHVFDVFTGNGAPALDDAIAESVDWFEDTLRIRRW